MRHSSTGPPSGRSRALLADTIWDLFVARISRDSSSLVSRFMANGVRCSRKKSSPSREKRAKKDKKTQILQKNHYRVTLLKSGANSSRSIPDFTNDFNSYFVSLVNLPRNKSQFCSNITQIRPA
jgi:hypothetical protein